MRDSKTNIQNKIQKFLLRFNFYIVFMADMKYETLINYLNPRSRVLEMMTAPETDISFLKFSLYRH